MPLLLKLPGMLGAPSSWSEATDRAEHSEMRAAIAYFRRVLGERWRGCAQRSHLARLFHTKLQRGEREWVRLHRLASALDDVANVELLVRDLASTAWERHVAAEQALEFCGRLHACGHEVVIIRPTHNRSPDVQVRLADRLVTVEFKALHDPAEQATWDAFVDALQEELSQRGLGPDFFPFDVEFHPPALKHQADVAVALSDIAARADTTLHLLPNGAGAARYVADPANRWLRLPVNQRSDLERIVASLGGKYGRQLRTVGGPTLLVVLTQHLFLVPITHIPIVVRHTSDALQRALSARPTIGGILLHEEPFEPARNPLLHREEGWRFAMCATERRARTTLLVENRAAAVRFASAELEVLVGENIRW